MGTLVNPQVDLIVLSRRAGALHPQVEQGLRSQRYIQTVVHRIVGRAQPKDRCRFETIARARNNGKLCGRAPWLMFVDDDVVLEPQCIWTMVNELSRRPSFAALAADYLGERRVGRIASHVSMGATLFRREALEQIRFDWRDERCECQCCCDDLRRLRWGIDYCPAAKARHLPKGQTSEDSSRGIAVRGALTTGCLQEHVPTGPAKIPSVCLLACYFGPPPGWIKHFLLSCAYNPSIDFLLFTDQKDFPAAPPNVRLERLSRSSFELLATKKIGMEIRLSHPRKLCDFKPAYGHLFEEFLDGWDYWGYTDLDVIYGDLRRFLSSAMLQEFDVFTARKEFLVGHFTLLRNSRRMNTLYQQSADLGATLQSKDVLSFDECGKQWRQRLQGKPLSNAATCDSMSHVVHRMVTDNQITACFSPAVIEWPELAVPAWRLRWREGRLWSVDQRREVMYFHFHAFKHRRGYCAPYRHEGNAPFEMSPKGFERTALPVGR